MWNVVFTQKSLHWSLHGECDYFIFTSKIVQYFNSALEEKYERYDSLQQELFEIEHAQQGLHIVDGQPNREMFRPCSVVGIMPHCTFHERNIYCCIKLFDCFIIYLYIYAIILSLAQFDFLCTSVERCVQVPSRNKHMLPLNLCQTGGLHAFTNNCASYLI